LHVEEKLSLSAVQNGSGTLAQTAGCQSFGVTSCTAKRKMKGVPRSATFYCRQKGVMMPLYRHHWGSVAAFEKHCRARLGFFVTSATFRRSHWSLGGRHSFTTKSATSARGMVG